MTAPAVECPRPLPPGDLITLAHGDGAGLTRRLIRDDILAALGNDFLRPLADAAVLPPVAGELAFTTDSYVVTPLFFPGGDIGRLAVCGTVNDLAVCGADPLYLSLGLVIEEGFPRADLRRVLAGVADAARECGVHVVTGDTKVVPRGAADRLFLNTAGVGRRRPGVELGADRVRPGDRVLVTGTVGDHGLAVLNAREQFLEPDALRSDAAPLHTLAAALIAAGGGGVRFLRDATRGGVAAVLHELTDGRPVGARVDEPAVPVSAAVGGACELLGLDPLFVANEGKLVAVVAPEAVDAVLAAARTHPLGGNAAVIGELTPDHPGRVTVRGAFGQTRLLVEPAGCPLPRIC